MIGEKDKQLVFMGSDHAGFKSKNELREYLAGDGYDVTDLGCFSEESVDYPDIAREVSEKVLEHPEAFGILLCGSGNGMAMAANKLKGIRAGLALNENMAEMTRRHNNANILSMGARDISIDEMKKIVKKFLTTKFEAEEERHVRRVEKLNEIS